MKICILTYGCAANRAESEMMAGLLNAASHKLVKESEAEIIILNTCIVKQVTEQKILDKLSTIKKPVVVAGCMPEVYGRKIRERNPNAALLGTHQMEKIVDVVESATNGNYPILTGPTRTEKLGLPRIRSKKETAIIEIADGCLGNCSYCATRLAKGPLFSYRPSSIIKEICSSLRDGCKEIHLTAQDTAAYGKDIGASLSLLLSLLPSGNYKVRIGMMNPNSVLPILDRLIEAYKDPKILKFLHLPVQSGSDEILKVMNRPYGTKDFEHIINAFRKAFPDIYIFTDVIVGYPGETDKQFQNTVELLKRIRPNRTNVSRFAKRDNTPAVRLKPLPSEVLKRRTRILSSLVF